MPPSPSYACTPAQELAAAHRALACLHALTLHFLDSEAEVSAVVAQVPPMVREALSHPQALAVAVRLDGQTWTAGDMSEDALHIAPLVVQGVRRGSLRLGGEERWVLEEDRRLLDQVALQLSSLIAKKEAQTARRKLEAQVRRADRLAKVGQLAAGLGHELNEPLANILGFAQLAAATPGVPESVRRDLARIEAAAMQCREIIKKLLVFGRQMPLQRQRVDLADVISQARDLVAASAERHGVLLEVTVDGAPVVQADAGQLVQAVVNLAVNAIHAMPTGGVLRLAAYAEAGNAVVAVEDSGMGMSPEVLRQIFHPFFTTKGPDGGTGLGLAVVHGIVSAHGGALDVQSTPNEGSRFEIVLPLWEDSASEESA